MATQVKWNLNNIREGIERFLLENDHLPTATDYDRCPYLPSARQIQRVYGGLEKLRNDLGYQDVNYTKGSLRKAISQEGHTRGLGAEDYLEPLLINHFGEPFVHTQKRYYKKLKNRYDFFIYYQNNCFGIDVFATQRLEYIGPNIRHKLGKYKDVPKNIPIYFIAFSEKLTPDDIAKGAASAKELANFSNIHVIHMDNFLNLIKNFQPLSLPPGFKSAIEE